MKAVCPHPGCGQEVKVVEGRFATHPGPHGDCPGSSRWSTNPAHYKSITSAMVEAATEALGYPVDAARIQEALDTEGEPDPDRLKELVAEFERAGGRGVELAEEIDNLRILAAITPFMG